jgi:nitronate monooxygenase
MAKLNPPNQQDAKLRAMAFSKQFGLQLPILEAPMAGACPVELAVAVAEGGGMGAMGALLSSPEAIREWAAEFRSRTNARSN